MVPVERVGSLPAEESDGLRLKRVCIVRVGQDKSLND